MIERTCHYIKLTELFENNSIVNFFVQNIKIKYNNNNFTVLDGLNVLNVCRAAKFSIPPPKYINNLKRKSYTI